MSGGRVRVADGVSAILNFDRPRNRHSSHRRHRCPMTSERMAINPELIRWARERAGYSLEVAEVHFRDIRAWESRRKPPTYVQLESLADRFGIPVSVLFFPEPPDVTEPSRSFRTLPEHEFAALPPRMHLLVRKAQPRRAHRRPQSGRAAHSSGI